MNRLMEDIEPLRLSVIFSDCGSIARLKSLSISISSSSLLLRPKLKSVSVRLGDDA